LLRLNGITSVKTGILLEWQEKKDSYRRHACCYLPGGVNLNTH